MPLLFAIFVAVPIVEIALFIQVGGWIGLWPTLAIVVLTAIAGTWLLRQQGLAALARLQGALNRLSDPSQPLAEGAMILFAGALLLTPGFFTDACGLALMVPGLRVAIYRALRRRLRGSAQVELRMKGFGPTPPRPGPDDVIDGEFQDMTAAPGRDTPSGWTRH